MHIITATWDAPAGQLCSSASHAHACTSIHQLPAKGRGARAPASRVHACMLAWTDLTPPPSPYSYNSFFHGVLPKVQGAFLTGGTLYGVYLVMFCESKR